jgi:hypothetical protein
MRWYYTAVLIGSLSLAGCGGDGERGQLSRDTGGMSGSPGPAGTGMGRMDSSRARMRGGQMTPEMRAHMDSMMRMSPDRMRAHSDSMMRMPPEQRRAMMARHQRMMAQMMEGMSPDSGMQMAAVPEWRALRDSVRADLAELPTLEGGELSARLRRHTERVQRLLAMQEQMVGK